MGIWDRAADRIERAAEQEREFGDLVHTTLAGLRTYLRGDVVTATGPDVSTLRTIAAGVDLATLR